MPRKRRHYRSRNTRHFGDPNLYELTDDELLDLRFCDLNLRIEGTPLEQRIDRLHREMGQKGIRFRPYFWLSDDWFTPDGITGIAIPFYLAHPRLMRLEGRQMLEVEGGTETWCMKILRHEAGHAIDNAYRLRRKKRYRELFGPASQPYPQYYNPKPFSKSYVLHLDMWYAQSHPVEDFAETFAVWLTPRSAWKTQYEGWRALKKLDCVDELMADYSADKPPVKTRQHVDPVRSMNQTLRSHYAKKRTHYAVDDTNIYDQDLKRLFANGNTIGPSAAAFLRKIRPSLRRAVAHWTGQYLYTIDQILGEMIDRCRVLKLRLDRGEREVERDALIMLTMQTMNYLHSGHHRVAL
jgi:hypothetical protein